MRDTPKLTSKIQFRCSQIERNRIQALANIYAEGNISLWLMYSAFSAPRKRLNKDEMDESRRKILKRSQK